MKCEAARQKGRTVTRKMGKNKPKRAANGEADDGARDRGAGSVLIGPLCKQRRSFRYVESSFPNSFRLLLLLLEVGNHRNLNITATSLAHMCGAEDRNDCATLPTIHLGPGSDLRTVFPEVQSKTITLETQESQHMPPTHPSSLPASPISTGPARKYEPGSHFIGYLETFKKLKTENTRAGA